MSKLPTNLHRSSRKSNAQRPAPSKSAPGLAPAAAPPAVQLALAKPAAASPDAILSLQRLGGNRAVSGLIQAKLRVGAADDPYEREADQVAQRVLQRTTASTAQRQTITPMAPGRPAGVQRAAGAGGLAVQSDIEQRLAASQGRGTPLPTALQRQMEQGFGADFSGVRVHTGRESVQLSRDLQARAFTHGRDIYMGAGEYRPNSTAGQRLLAHELTHVVQQTGRGPASNKAVTKTGQAQTARIQRYADNAYRPGARVNWLEETASVKRSGEGVSGGVFFFKGKAGPLPMLVVKPEYAGDAEDNGVTAEEEEQESVDNQAKGQFSDNFLRAMSIAAPNSRVVAVKSAEAEQIVSAARGGGAPIPENIRKGMAMAAKLKFFKVMSPASGRSLGSAVADVQDPWDVNSLIATLNSDALLRKIGRLVVADSFAGNTDRINAVKPTNIGNIMYGGQDLTAIDSEAEFAKIDSNSENVGDFNKIEEIFSERKDIIHNFLRGILYNLPEKSEAKEHFQNFINTDPFNWRGRIEEGMDEGILALRELLGSKQRRGEKKALKRDMKSWQKAGSKVSDWNTFRIKERYLELRAAGLEAGEAKQQAMEYARYREDRQALPKGFKWLAKVKRKFGF